MDLCGALHKSIYVDMSTMCSQQELLTYKPCFTKLTALSDWV